MKKIMILGAGIYQVPLIKTAKRLGLYTIVVIFFAIVLATTQKKCYNRIAKHA